MTTQAFRFLNVGVVGFVVCWTTLFIFWEGTASRLVREDGVIEWIQFLFLVATTVCCYLIARGYRRYYNSPLVRGGFLLFSLLSILLAAEEISWGQRLLAIETPVLLQEINVQNEITLHNLEYVQRVRHWLLIFFGASGLLMTFAADRLRTRASQKLLTAFLPPHNFRIIFALILVSGLYVEVAELFKLVSTDVQAAERLWFIAGRFSEIGELLVALAACWYSLVKGYEMKLGLWNESELAGEA